MKRIVIATVAVLMLMGLVVSAQANPIAIEFLKVYDENGQEMGMDVATATATSPIYNLNLGVAQLIRITAHIADSLKVRLSATDIRWDVKKTGRYQAKAIDITVDSPVVYGDSEDQKTSYMWPQVSMSVSGAGDLQGDEQLGAYYEEENGNTIVTGPPWYNVPLIPTSYALRPTYQTGVPQPAEYRAALDFNGVHQLYPGGMSLWNKIETRGRFGNYEDEFTVTFSQNI